MPERIKVLFRKIISGGPRNIVLNGGSDLLTPYGEREGSERNFAHWLVSYQGIRCGLRYVAAATYFIAYSNRGLRESTF